MLLLDYHNKIIEDTLLEKFNVTDGKYDSVEAIVADFDAVLFHLFTDANSKNLLNISMSIKCLPAQSLDTTSLFRSIPPILLRIRPVLLVMLPS
jgi:hypothetical protein